MAFDLLVRAFFTDSGLSAGLEKANAGLEKLGRSAPGARTGLRLAERGLQTLALEAVGVTGPLGRVSEGLLKIGGGSALALGAAAGIGLIAAAYHNAVKPFKELTDAIDQLDASYGKFLARGHPELIALRTALIAARANLAHLQEQAPGASEGITFGTPGQIELARTQVADLQRQVNAVLGSPESQKAWVSAFLAGIKDLGLDEQLAELTSHKAEFDARGKEAGKAWLKAYLDIVAGHGAVLGLQLPPVLQGALRAPLDAQFNRLDRVQNFGRPGTVSAPGMDQALERERQAAILLQQLLNPTAAFDNALQLLRTSLAYSTLTADERKRAEDELRKSMGQTGKAAQASAAAMISAFAGLAQLAASGGSAGGFLSAIGGIVGLLPGGQVAGAAIAGVGGIISASDGKNHVIVDSLGDQAARQMRDAQGVPQNVTLYLVDANGRVTQTASRIQHEERKDASRRFVGV